MLYSGLRAFIAFITISILFTGCLGSGSEENASSAQRAPASDLVEVDGKSIDSFVKSQLSVVDSQSEAETLRVEIYRQVKLSDTGAMMGVAQVGANKDNVSYRLDVLKSSAQLECSESFDFNSDYEYFDFLNGLFTQGSLWKSLDQPASVESPLRIQAKMSVDRSAKLDVDFVREEDRARFKGVLEGIRLKVIQCSRVASN